MTSRSIKASLQSMRTWWSGVQTEQPVAGHVLEVYVSPTLEVMVAVDPVAMRKRFDPETDLTLIDPAPK